ncbi:MAG: serine/threonine protein kinase [Oleiphilus sp.]|nr:MAG: serine/threonine protein kinase [Oleiphilus sp.]
MKEGRYEYQEKIGEGGMATVYKGLQRSLNRPVAIKVLDGKLSDNPSLKKRFKRESLIIARLNHPNIIHVIDRGMTSKGRPVFIMEFVEGTNLADAIYQNLYDFNTKVDLTIQICKGVAYAHKLDVIHRDIKPANVIVDPEGHARLLDFGIASFFEKDGDNPEENKLILGTEAYMAPEAHKGVSATTRQSDIYSLGVVMFELFTGHLPGASPVSELASDPDMSQALSEIILRCMEKDPGRRPASVEDVKTQLLLAMQGQHIAEEQASRADEGMASVSSKFGLLDVMREDRHGAAYLYEDKISHNLLVIKKLRDTDLGFREAKMLTTLKSPNLVNILGASKNANVFIVVMDYVAGGSLQDRLIQPMQMSNFVPLAIQIAKGIAFAHQNRICHGNLRPSNVLLTSNMQVKLSDFGLDEHYRLKSDDRNWYGDPRKARDELADIFSMGAIFYHCLTGMPPAFKEGQLKRSKYFLDQNEELRVLIERMLAKDVDMRPQSAEAVVSELLPFIEDLKTEEKTLVAPKPQIRTKTVVEYRHKKGLAVGLGIILVASLCLNGLLLSDNSEEVRTAVINSYQELIGLLSLR